MVSLPDDADFRRIGRSETIDLNDGFNGVAAQCVDGLQLDRFVP
jgi:hypothetical protein